MLVLKELKDHKVKWDRKVTQVMPHSLNLGKDLKEM
jgi:hypothetical protein